uniref:Uncharacterized protein n=1 Tax=Rhodnius prolixus TaxID=13249 RepID=T1HEV2_RHOPR
MDEESNEEIDKEFKQILTTCSFCDVVLDNMESVKKCKLLQCLHSICDNCVQYIHSQGNKETYCPKCTLPVNMEKLLDHKILEELIAFEDETNVTCMMHPSESVTHWCNNCLEYICDVCIKLHLQLKATKEHEIIPKMEYLKFNENKQGNFPCKLHPSEQLTLVCTTCKQMTCRDCQLDLHREHGHEFLGTAVVPAKSEILLTYIQLEHHKLLLDEAHKLIKERRNEITQRKQEVHKEINTFSQNLVNIIMKWTKNLIGNLDMITSKQLTLYDTQAESVKDLTRPIIHTLKFVKKTLKTSSDTSILYYKDAHGQVLASNPVPEQYGRSAALTPAAPTQPPPPQPPPVVIQQPTRHSQSSYANQLLLQQRQSHHQSMQQHANAAHHPQPAGYTNTVKMSYAEMRMHATTPQIPTPSQASYPNHQYPAAHTKPLHHQYPWPGATPSMVYPNTSRSPAHYPAQPPGYGDRQQRVVQQRPQTPVASWHIPQPRTSDAMSTSSGGTPS